MELKGLLLLVFVVTLAEASYIRDLNNQLRRVSQRGELKTLDQFLRENPDVRHISLSKRKSVNCNEVCGPIPGVSGENECAEWAPDYEVKGSCHCIHEFKCCPNPCPKADKTVCWANNKEGFKYPVETRDCCDCPIYKCVTCEPVEDPAAICKVENHDYPLKCFDYKNHGASVNETRCFRSTCEFNPPDPPANEQCDNDCMRSEIERTDCGKDYEVCVSDRVKTDCPLDSQAESSAELQHSLKCYHPPTEVAHPEGGKFYQSHQCVDCVKWKYDKISCDKKNEEASAYECHHDHETKYDKVCWKKMTEPDECKCDVAHCVKTPERDATHEFRPGERCPEGYKKVSGVSICGYNRDVCLQCPEVKEPENCDLKFNRIVNDHNCNNCPIKRCDPITIPTDACDSNTYHFDIATKTFSCVPKVTTCFNFPESETTAHVDIRPLKRENLNSLTFDVMYTMRNETKDPWILSFVSTDHKHELLIGPNKGFHVKSGSVATVLKSSMGKKMRLTIVWNLLTGDFSVYENMKLERKGNMKTTISTEGFFMLGQMLGVDGYESEKRFIGKLCGFQMWDRVLSKQELEHLFQGDLSEKGNLFDSPATYEFELKDGAEGANP